MPTPFRSLRHLLGSLVQWIDSDYSTESPESIRAQPDGINLIRCIPFAVLHLGCLGVLWTGGSWFALWTAVALYFIRMFAVTGVSHRYFSHKTYRTSRFGQFLLALFAATTVQRGALWWAYHHRHHHQHSDEPEDAHSPHVHGFLWSHIGWITSRRNFPTDYSKIRDLARYPELVFLNRFDILVPVLFAVALFMGGHYLGLTRPDLHTSGAQLLVWGFFISTTALFHGTACINSLAHLMGRRRFETADDSRNSFILSLITLGEGWHNNHHRYMSATRQGFYWWEIDPTYYLLKALSWTGFIWDLKTVPASVYQEAEHRHHHDSVARFSVSSVQHEIHALRRAMPTAAVMALASVHPAENALPKPPAKPAIHCAGADAPAASGGSVPTPLPGK